MTSTRNLNNKADYLCEKGKNIKMQNYLLSSYYGEQQGSQVTMFDIGSGPAKMHSSHFSHNPVDVESKLFGIRSTNLEGPSFDPNMKAKTTQSKELFKNHLKDVYLPNPVIHHKMERPGFHNL
jgi:hypothetical protein